jgi:serine/threonine protein phosphatase PrpC
MRHTDRTVERIGLQILEDSSSPAGTEDALFATDGFAGVFDGATSLTGSDVPGPRGGAIAATLARDVFASGGEQSLVDLARTANERIAEAMAAANVDRSKPENRWGTTAAAVRVADAAIDWVSIGDSPIVVVLEDGTFRPLVPLYDHDRTTKRLVAALGGSAAGRRQRLHGDLLSVRSRANVEYGVLNGEPAARDFIVHGREPRSGVRHLLVFTDGLLVPRADPDGEDDLAPIVSRFVAGGLASARDFVRALEDADLDCTMYPRLKPHDDIAAVALTLAPSEQEAMNFTERI